MKHTKKLIATTMAMTMVMGSMPILAADALTTPTSGVAGNPIDGSVNYTSTTVYSVTLPTTDTLSFALDPQGLTTLSSGSVAEGSEGLIVGTGEMVAENKSSVPIDLEVGFYVTTSSDELKLVSDTVDDSKEEIKLVIQKSDTTGTGFSDFLTVTSEDAQTPTEDSISMEAATYEFAGDGSSTPYTYQYKSGGDSVYMKISGTVAKDFDWSAYVSSDTNTTPKTIELNAVFGFSDPAITVATDDYVMTLNDDGTVSYTFVDAPEGDLTAFSLNGTVRNGQLGSGVTYSNGVLTMSKSLVGTTISGWFVTGENTIVVTIGSTADIQLTYTAQ